MSKQLRIIEKAVAFLKKELTNSINETDIHNRTEVIDWLSEESTGVCTALSNLHLYGRKISDLQKSTTKTIDNIENIEKYTEMLLNWDENKEYSKHDHSEIERFISYLLNPYYKTISKFPGYFSVSLHEIPDIGISNDEYITLLNERLTLGKVSSLDHGDIVDDQETKLTTLSSGKLTLTENLLPDRLQKIIKPGDMILAYVDNMFAKHSMAMYHSPVTNKIYFYDPNAEQEYSFNPIEDIHKISEKLWNWSKIDESIIDVDGNISIPIQNFEFIIRKFPNDPIYDYPKEDELKISLNEINDLLISIDEIFHSFILRECFSSSKELLELIKNNNLSEEFKTKLLHYLAINISTNETEIAKELLDNWENYIKDHKYNLLSIINYKNCYEKLLKIISDNDLDINTLSKKEISNLILKELPQEKLEVFLLSSNIMKTHDIMLPLLSAKILIQNENFNPIIIEKFLEIIDLSKNFQYNYEINPLKIYFTDREQEITKEILLKFKHVIDFFNSNNDEFSVKNYSNEQLQDILNNTFCSYKLSKILLKDINNLSDSLLNLLINKYQYLYTKDELHTLNIQMEKLKDSFNDNYTEHSNTDVTNLTDPITQPSDVSLIDNTAMFNDQES